MSYRKIEPRMWDDERFAPLSKDAKLVWVCILTGPHTTPLPGLSTCGLATLSESIRDGIDTVSKAVSELSSAGMLHFNPVTRLMQVPNAPRYNPCANPKVLKGWFSLWKNIPDCAEKYAHIACIRRALDETQAWTRTAWAETFGTVSVPARYSTDTVSETVSISGALTQAQAQAGAVGGVGETPLSPSVVPTSGAPSPRPVKVRRVSREPTPDTTPLPGTVARAVYDVIVSDPALAPITGNPGDASVRWSDPSTYPGVDVVAEIRRAGEYAATKPGRYTDGRAFLRGWLQRKADEVARAPRPAPQVSPSVDLSDPWEAAKARYEAEERERIAKAREARKAAGGAP